MTRSNTDRAFEKEAARVVQMRHEGETDGRMGDERAIQVTTATVERLVP